MAIKCHVKRNDEVIVLAGKDKGKRGRVLRVFPKEQRVLVEGVNKVKKHVRRSQQYPHGAIIEQEAPIHISNVMLVEKYEARRAKRINAQKQKDSVGSAS